MNLLDKKIKDQGWVLADGATGTNYFLQGLEAGYPPELWCIEKPNEVIRLHKMFLNSGCDIILTNSFGSNECRLKLHGAEKRVVELNKIAAELASEAIKIHYEETGFKKIIAGSIGPTGELFKPLGLLTKNLAIQTYAEQAKGLVEGGVDFLWIETISSLEEADAAITAAKTTNVPIIVTMTFDTAGKSMMGVSPSNYADYVSKQGVYAFGANCGLGPAEIIDSIVKMNKKNNMHIVAKGNCGIPQFSDGLINYPMTPELMGSYAKLVRDAGASIIGGCCGTTPEHTLAMHHALTSSKQLKNVNFTEAKKYFGDPWPHIKSVVKDRRRKKRRKLKNKP